MGRGLRALALPPAFVLSHHFSPPSRARPRNAMTCRPRRRASPGNLRRKPRGGRAESNGGPALRSLGRQGLAAMVERHSARPPASPKVCARAGFIIWNEVVLNSRPAASSRKFSATRPAGAEGPRDRATPSCASAFRRGPRPMRTWSEVWRQWCASPVGCCRRNRNFPFALCFGA